MANGEAAVNCAMRTLRSIRGAASEALRGIAPNLHGRVRLGRRLTRYCRHVLKLDVSTVSVRGRERGSTKPHIVDIAVTGDRIGVVCDALLLAQKPEEVFQRAATVLSVAAGSAAKRGLPVAADISDGEDSDAGLLSFCSYNPGAILIPDHLFNQTRGYERERELARVCVTTWDARNDQILWRGSTTGIGLISKPDLDVADAELIPRVRLCLALKNVPGTDVKLSGVTQSQDKRLDQQRLAAAGILGEFVYPMTWYGFKFAIAIDGNSNTWSAFFTRLLMGCCVLKVDSPYGYRQWYYKDLEPWTHYVPVKADLSDLHDAIAWCRTHSAECRRIAAEGQAFAMARDYVAEMSAARERVDRALAQRNA